MSSKERKQFVKDCAEGKLSKVKDFLKKNPDFDINYRESGAKGGGIWLGVYSPLGIAAKRGRLEVCQYLIENCRNVDVNYRSGRKRDYTPLDCAIHWANKSVVECLALKGGLTHDQAKEREKKGVAKFTANNEKAITNGSVAGVGGAAGGALVGAAIGSAIFFGVGTGIGLVIGAAIGGVSGSVAAGGIGAAQDAHRQSRRSQANSAQELAKKQKKVDDLTKEAEEAKKRSDKQGQGLSDAKDEAKKNTERTNVVTGNTEALGQQKKEIEDDAEKLRAKLAAANKGLAELTSELNEVRKGLKSAQTDSDGFTSEEKEKLEAKIKELEAKIEKLEKNKKTADNLIHHFDLGKKVSDLPSGGRERSYLGHVRQKREHAERKKKSCEGGSAVVGAKLAKRSPDNTPKHPNNNGLFSNKQIDLSSEKLGSGSDARASLNKFTKK